MWGTRLVQHTTHDHPPPPPPPATLRLIMKTRLTGDGPNRPVSRRVIMVPSHLRSIDGRRRRRGLRPLAKAKKMPKNEKKQTSATGCADASKNAATAGMPTDGGVQSSIEYMAEMPTLAGSSTRVMIGRDHARHQCFHDALDSIEQACRADHPRSRLYSSASESGRSDP